MADDLVVAVGANIANLQRAMNEAADAAGRTADNIERKFNEVNPGLNFAVGALKGALAALSIQRLVGQILQANSEMASFGDTARRVGLTLQGFQELRLAAQSQGLTGAEADRGLEGLAKILNDASHQTTKLGQLFDDNNIKIKTAAGGIIDMQTALSRVADLIQNAGSEWDKIKIAEAAGLTKEWIPLLEQGAAGLSQMATAASKTGAIIDEQMIRKAQEFQKEWDSATAVWSANAKSALAGILPYAAEVGRAVQSIFDPARVRDALALRSAIADVKDNGLQGASLASLEAIAGNCLKEVGGYSTALADRLAELREMQRESNRGKGFNNIGTVPTKGGGGAAKPTTNARSLFAQPKSASSSEDAETSLERTTRLLEQQTKVLNEQTGAVGLGTFAKADNTAIQKLLNAALNDGEEIGTKFKTAQDLLAASSASLTPEMAKQRDAILATADAYAKAQEAAAKAAENQRRLADLNRFTQDTFSGLLKDTLSNIRNGEGAWKAFADAASSALTRISDKLIDMAISDLFTSAFGGKGSSGLWGSILGAFGGGGGGGGTPAGFSGGLGQSYDVGGYTGPGGRNQVAGFVHRGEVVWSQDDVRNAGGVGVVEAMRRRMPGFAAGGPVGLTVPSLAGLGGGRQSAPIQFSYAPRINMPGADSKAVDQMAQVIAKDRSEFESRVRKIVSTRDNLNW